MGDGRRNGNGILRLLRLIILVFIAGIAVITLVYTTIYSPLNSAIADANKTLATEDARIEKEAREERTILKDCFHSIDKKLGKIAYHLGIDVKD